MLTGKNIQLRYLEQSDLEFLYNVENDEKLWVYASKSQHFSKKILSDYIHNAKQDIEISKQVRFVISYKGKAVGMIDLFDYNCQSAGVGVIVLQDYQKKGFAKESLSLLTDYAFSNLKLKKLFCSITANNIASIKLFTSFGFKLKSIIKGVNYYIFTQ